MYDEKYEAHDAYLLFEALMKHAAEWFVQRNNGTIIPAPQSSMVHVTSWFLNNPASESLAGCALQGKRSS